MGRIYLFEKGLKMTTSRPVIDLDVIDEKPAQRKGDGGTYLVIADDSEEFKLALKYACTMAHTRRAHVGILYVIENEDFQQWGTVEARMKKELREQAEKYLWNIAKSVNETNGMLPSLYIAEGDRQEALIDTIDKDPMVAQLILGGHVEGGSPGPLVSYIMGKGLGRLRVPIVLIPGHLKDFP
jgi:nucleotide-binding universal stress UspA family protein